MAIQDQSIYSEYLARSIANTGKDSLDLLSGGTLTESQKDDVYNMIQLGLQASAVYATTGTVPPQLYIEVAEKLFPTTPMSVPAIVNILQSNNMFGLVQGISNDGVMNNELSNLLQQYTASDNYVQNAFNVFQSSSLTSGYSNDVRNIISGGNANILGNIMQGYLNKQGYPVSITRPLVSSITAMVSKNPSVRYSSFPPGVQTVLNNYVREGILNPSRATYAYEIGGTKTLTTNWQDPNQLALDFSKNSKKEITKIASESLIHETGAQNVPIESVIKKVGDAFSTLADQGQTFNPYEFEQKPKEIGSTIDGGLNFISSVEELEAEMSSMTRPISEIIVHWSETYTDANLNADQLTFLTGAGTNAYHLIVKRDGSIQRGVPMNQVGNHCDINNHNAWSIGVCLIGGINVASGDDEIENSTAASITRTQFNTLYQIFRTFFNQYPGGQALGHMDVDITQEDPGFDVRNYVYNNFNKTSLYKNPLTDLALSPSDILAALEGQGPTVLIKDPDVMDKKF